MSDPRFFLSHASGQLDVVNVPAEVSAALEIMLADNVPADTAADLSWAAQRDGQDPSAFARHFVELRQAFRGER